MTVLRCKLKLPEKHIFVLPLIHQVYLRKGSVSKLNCNKQTTENSCEKHGIVRVAAEKFDGKY